VSFVPLFAASGRRPAAAWAPADLADLRRTVQVYRAWQDGLLWQDAGKTTPVAADGDPARVSVCPDTAGEWAAPSDSASPLLWDEGGGKASLFFDGVDDSFDGAAISFGAGEPWTIGASLLADTGGHSLLINPIGFCIVGGSGNQLMVRSDANHTWLGPNGSWPSGAGWAVLTLEWSGSALSVWLDGAPVAPNSDTLAAGDAWTFRAVGANIGSGTYSGRLSQLLVSGGAGYEPALRAFVTARTP
jgi:hypothetical protein